jgi:hypothetical protein
MIINVPDSNLGSRFREMPSVICTARLSSYVTRGEAAVLRAHEHHRDKERSIVSDSLFVNYYEGVERNGRWLGIGSHNGRGASWSGVVNIEIESQHDGAMMMTHERKYHRNQVFH